LSIEKSEELNDHPTRFAAAFNVKISTDKPAAFVWLDSGEIRGRFSENGFIFTEAETTVQFWSLQEDLTAEDLTNVLTIQSLHDAMKKV
jgi:beta-mannosidase